MSAYVAISLSVLMHVIWNLLARHVDSRCNFLWWGLLAHVIMLGPWALTRLVIDSQWNTQLIAAMGVSALANTVYFLALRKAYHYAPVALVYPVVRSSPVLIVIWAWLLFGQEMVQAGLVGIGISVLGLWLLAGSSRKGDTAHALPWAILAAFATSIYSLSDKVAVPFLPSFGAQLGFITVGYTASFIALTISQYTDSRSLIPPCKPALKYVLPGGLFIGVAYALVVRAMLELPAAYVVAYTNAGIVLATILSILVFKEREKGARRLLAAFIITAGLVVLGLNR
ncbi:MAG: EamA family transporter [Thioalkalispiraceae bacterium]|jgi:phosphonate utilization associated putative membrane protein